MNEIAVRFRLTPSEMDAVQHRLDVPDALASCLSVEENPDGGGFPADVLDEVTAALELGNLSDAERVNVEATRAVLADAVEGATLPALALSEDLANGDRKATRQGGGKLHRAAVRHLENAAAKLAPYVGRALNVPRV